jgi:hypothetical protein
MRQVVCALIGLAASPAARAETRRAGRDRSPSRGSGASPPMAARGPDWLGRTGAATSRCVKLGASSCSGRDPLRAGRPTRTPRLFWWRPRPATALYDGLAAADARLPEPASGFLRDPATDGRCPPRLSARWQRGHTSPTAHNNIAGTTDLQTGQRTCARCTISTLQSSRTNQSRPRTTPRKTPGHRVSSILTRRLGP